MPVYDCGSPNCHECRREFRSMKNEAVTITTRSALEIEGLAAQLYMASLTHGAYVWWHMLRDGVKAEFRFRAAQEIAALAVEPLPF